MKNEVIVVEEENGQIAEPEARGLYGTRPDSCIVFEDSVRRTRVYDEGVLNVFPIGEELSNPMGGGNEENRCFVSPHDDPVSASSDVSIDFGPASDELEIPKVVDRFDPFSTGSVVEIKNLVEVDERIGDDIFLEDRWELRSRWAPDNACFGVGRIKCESLDGVQGAPEVSRKGLVISDVEMQ